MQELIYVPAPEDFEFFRVPCDGPPGLTVSDTAHLMMQRAGLCHCHTLYYLLTSEQPQ
jgi:hypothetical protein